MKHHGHHGHGHPKHIPSELHGKPHKTKKPHGHKAHADGKNMGNEGIPARGGNMQVVNPKTDELEHESHTTANEMHSTDNILGPGFYHEEGGHGEGNMCNEEHEGCDGE